MKRTPKYHVLKVCDKSACSNAYITYNDLEDRFSCLKVFNNNSQINPQRAYTEELQVYSKLMEKHLTSVPPLHQSSTDITQIENIRNHHVSFGFFEIALGEYGDLLDFVTKYKDLEGSLGLPEKVAKFFFWQIVEGLAEMHRNNIVHRDVKPHNMILNHDLTLKFIDFGFACETEDGYVIGNKGTPGFKAPETRSLMEYDGFKADIYSAGICLFLLVAPETQLKDLCHKVSESCVNLVKGMISNDPRKRLSLDEIRNHAWFQIEGGVPSANEVKATLSGFLEKIWIMNDENVNDFICTEEVKKMVRDKLRRRGSEEVTLQEAGSEEAKMSEELLEMIIDPNVE